MATPGFTVDIVGDEITPALRRARQQLENLAPLMASLVGILDDEVQDAFATESDPVTGAGWDPLTPAYVARPRPAGRGGDEHPILQKGGALATPEPGFGADFAELRFSEVYAAAHQFGHAPGGIPARPFAGVSEGGVREILDTVERYLR